MRTGSERLWYAEDWRHIFKVQVVIQDYMLTAETPGDDAIFEQRKLYHLDIHDTTIVPERPLVDGIHWLHVESIREVLHDLINPGIGHLDLVYIFPRIVPTSNSGTMGADQSIARPYRVAL